MRPEPFVKFSLCTMSTLSLAMMFRVRCAGLESIESRSRASAFLVFVKPEQRIRSHRERLEHVFEIILEQVRQITETIISELNIFTSTFSPVVVTVTRRSPRA